ncbi:anti-sigma factor RsbA family regulatory protein [Planosporangium sp. 12N6]|uniref:anti-sigma factor RsbA family regulatory protein n=1 Tax=Planosporangium spinosum TaxID=3402278 RepID=UPI003CF3D1FB
MPALTVTNHVHQMLLWESPDDLLTAAVPFLRAGLTAGDAAILACRDEYNALLAGALGRDPRVDRVRSAGIYTRAAVTAETYRRLINQRIDAGARRVRVVGEPNFGTGPDAWAECERYEAIVNVALAACRVTTTCALDARTLPAPVIEDLITAHPFVLTPAGRVPNERYVDPATSLRRSAPGPDPVEWTGPAVEFAAVTDLHQVPDLRHQLRVALDTYGVARRIGENVVAAVHELVVNGLVHGRAPVRVRFWVPPGRLVCMVTDTGQGFDDPLAGYARPAADNPIGTGTGLWLARQLCDRIEMVRTRSGFTVRLSISTREAS